MAKCTPSIIASLLLLCLAGTALGQTTTIRGAGKGSSTPQPVTSTPVDANHTGVDVNIVGGGGSGGTASNFGAAFPATGTAIGLSDGVNMVPGLVDGSGYFEMNCKVGCSGSSFADNAAFTFGTTAIGLSGFVVDDTATNAVTENSAGLARMNANRIPYVMPTGNTGTALFPAAFASADNLAAQTATFIHGGLMAWDSGGSNWDRLLTTSGALNVNVQNASLAVTGTFFQATQPVSGTVTVTDGAGALNVIVDSLPTVTVTDGAGALNVIVDSGSVTVSNAFLLDATYTGRMPAGASPANGESNTNTTLSRIGSFNYVYNGSTWDRWTGAVTGAVTANAGTNLNTSALALSATQTDGTQKSIVRGGAKGSTTAADVTSTASGANHNILDVAIYDAAGSQITTFGGGTQYTEDAVSAADPVGTQLMARRRDTPAAETSTDGDVIAVNATNKGELYVKHLDAITVTDGAGALNVIVDSGTSIVTQATGTNLHMVCDSGCTPGGSFADNAAFTFGTTAINTMGAVVDDTATNTVTENSAGAPRMNTNRILYTMPTNSTGTALALALDASVDGLEGGIGAAADAAATVGSTGSLNAKERLMTSQLDAIQTAVQLIDNAVSGAGYNITQFGGTNVVTGVGASGAGIPRVTVANDSNILATQSGTWNIGTVTTLTGITNALPTGSNTIGAITGSVADNSANSSLKLPVLNSRANASAPSWTEGNQVPLSVDLVGNLRVNSTGGGAADGTTFTENSTTFSAAGGLYNDAIVSLTSGKEYAARITPYRALYTTELGTDGLERGTRTNPVNVSMTNFGAIVQQSSLLDPRNQANTVQITTMDAMGNLRAISQITDGQHYAALRGPEGSQATDYGMVVHNSVAPSIQCPYVFPVNQTANTQLVTNPGGRWLHVCGFQVVSAGAQNVSLVEGTGATCATASKGLYGGTTASVAFAANGGGGIFSDRIVMPMQVPGDNLCLMQSAANNVSGTLSYGIY